MNILNTTINTFLCLAYCLVLLSCSSGRLYFHNSEIMKRTVGKGKKECTEYYIAGDSTCSSTGWGVNCNKNDISLYLCYLDEKQTHYIDNDTQIEFMDFIIHDIVADNTAVLKNIDISIRLLGTAGLEISNDYQQTIYFDKNLGIWRSKDPDNDFGYLKKHHIYKSISNILNKYGYRINSITNDDPYPYPTEKMKVCKLIHLPTVGPLNIWDFHIRLNLQRK